MTKPEFEKIWNRIHIVWQQGQVNFSDYSIDLSAEYWESFRSYLYPVVDEAITLMKNAGESNYGKIPEVGTFLSYINDINSRSENQPRRENEPPPCPDVVWEVHANAFGNIVKMVAWRKGTVNMDDCIAHLRDYWIKRKAIQDQNPGIDKYCVWSLQDYLKIVRSFDAELAKVLEPQISIGNIDTSDWSVENDELPF